jgi:hypothetical protein
MFFWCFFNDFIIVCVLPKKPFEYNQEILIKYAVLGMEEYFSSDSSKIFKKEFDIDNPFIVGKIVDDCKGKKHKVVLVSFNNRKGKGNASVYMVYSNDSFFDTILNRGTSIQTAKKEIKYFRNNDYTDLLFSCEI